jgi:hypothetical protein
MPTSVQQGKVKALLIVTAFLLLLLCLGGLSMALSKERIQRFDFRTQYVAGYMVRAGFGHQLYDYEAARRFQSDRVSDSDKALPFIHLAYEALLYVPLSFFKYRTAYFFFLLGNLAFLGSSFFLLRPYLSELETIWSYLPIAIFACFLPVTMTLVEGQNSILLLLVMVLVFIKLDHGDDVSAGLIFGVASMKVQFVLPVAFLFLLWRRWRFLGGLAVSASALVTISILLTGLSGFASYLQLLGSMSARFSSESGSHLGIRPELMPNLRGLITVIFAGPSRVTHVLTLVTTAAVLIAAATKRRSFPFALLVALLVSYHETFTDAVLLILPIALASSAAARASTKRSRYLQWSCATVIVAPAPLLLLGVRFYLLCLPISAVLFFWDGVIVAGSETTNAPQAPPGTSAASTQPAITVYRTGAISNRSPTWVPER